jgi:hypothetical protein
MHVFEQSEECTKEIRKASGINLMEDELAHTIEVNLFSRLTITTKTS